MVSDEKEALNGTGEKIIIVRLGRCLEGSEVGTKSQRKGLAWLDRKKWGSWKQPPCPESGVKDSPGWKGGFGMEKHEKSWKGEKVGKKECQGPEKQKTGSGSIYSSHINLLQINFLLFT